MTDNSPQAYYTKSKSLKVLKARLEIRKRRGDKNLPAKDATLDAMDEQLFPIIRNNYTQKMMEETGAPPQDCERLFDAVADVYGKKAIVHMHAKEPLIYGVPYKWFFVNIIVAVVIFIFTQNSNWVVTVVAIIQGIEYLCYRCIKDRVDQEKADAILREGIKL